jgi:hypothetical protein
MSIKTEVDESRDLTIHTLRGKIPASNVKDVLEAFFKDRPTKNVLWDLRDAEPEGEVLSQDVELLATLTKKYEGLREKGRTALVASSDLVFGLAKMYQAFANIEGVKHPVEVFRSMDEAVRFIESEE